jgi:fibronectin type 3 domain-containing protein
MKRADGVALIKRGRRSRIYSANPVLPMHVLPRFALRAAGLIATALIFGAAARAQHYTTYDLVVPLTSPSTPSIIDGTGRLMPTNRSYIIGIEGGVRGTLVFTNWTAANPNYPVIVVNKHGTGRVVVKDDGVTYRDGIRFDNCAFMKLLGNNDPAHRYGFEVAQAGRLPSPGVPRISRLGVSVGNTSTNIEIGFVEVHHTGFAGIMAKTDPAQSRPETWAANYTMYDLSVHDCYVHDVGGEGMYIGYTGWATDHWPEAPGFESHEIIGMKVYNNLIERTMWDGFQYASAPDHLTTEVFNNVIVSSGTQGEAGQSNGAQIGAGGSGRFYDNIIIDSFGNNLAMFGLGYNAIYNNLFVDGDNGVFTDNRPNPPPADPDARQTIPGSYYSFYNNTIINPARHAFWSMSEVTVTNFFNNLSVVPSLAHTDAFADSGAGATINTGGNVLLRSLNDAGFVDPANHDYRLLPGSPAIDAGVSLAAADVPVLTDFQGNPRPHGGAYDAGFAEHGALSVFLISSPPPADGAASGSIAAATIGGTAPYAYVWSNGATSPTISGLSEGLYEVTVTDALGAKATRATYLIPGASMGAPVGVTPPYQVFAPNFSPVGGTYTTAQAVTLSCATPGANIRYTLDGSNPSDTAGFLYTGPISVDGTTTLRAVAFKTGLKPSAVESATYIIADDPVNAKFVIPSSAVTASSSNGANVGANAVDGNLSTNWASTGPGQWIQFDLGGNQRIGFVNVAVVLGTSRAYTFDLLVSTDATNWTPVLTGARTSLDSGLQKYDITDVQPVRYMRLVSYGNTSVPTANGYTEIEIWGGPVAAGGGPVPSAPGGLTASAGDAVVELTWTPSAGATSYNVRRATAPGGPYTTVGAGVVSLHYTDSTVANGTTYYYVVNGLNRHGLSANSNEASAVPRGFPPAAPTGLVATAGDGQVGLNWNPVAKATSYQVKRATTNGGPYATIATGLTATNYIDLGLTNGTTYVYVVSGVNAEGEGVDSAAANATPQAGYGGIWHILTPAEWGQTGGGFCPATHAFDSQPTWNHETQTPVGNDVEPHRSTLTEYANRFWYMDLGQDYASWRITQMWTRYRPNSAGTYNGFALMWWDDDKDTVNDGISAPEMNFAAGGTLANVNPQVWLRDRDFSATPITPQGRYLVVSTGPTVSSRPNEFAFVGYRESAAPPAPPTGLGAVPAPGAAVNLAWNASLGATSYTIKRSTTSGGPYAIVAANITSTNHPVMGLSDGATYVFVVTASNARGESANSNEASATADGTAPVLTLPADLVVEATNASGAVATFSVSATDAISGSVETTATPASGSTFPLGATTVTVSASDSAGNVATGSFTVTVQDTTAPAIQQLTASPNRLWPANHHMVNVTLAATVTDAVDPAPRTRVIAVESNEPVLGIDDGATTPDWEITGDLTVRLRAERSGVGTGRVYTIIVESRDSAGNASTATVTVTVPLSASSNG